MVQLITNVTQYENDIAEEIRLFLGAVEICREDAGAEYRMQILLDRETRTASGTLNGESASFPVFPDGGDALECKRQEKRPPLIVPNT